MCSTLYEPHHQQLMGFAAAREAKRQKCHQQQLHQALELDGSSGVLRVAQSRNVMQQPQQEQQQQQQQQVSRILGNQRLLEILSSSSSSSLQQQQHSSSLISSSSSSEMALEQHEHLFYKVVTPSDVGKLNRLVIPKQHAERCFPLDPLLRKKGRLLSFQDAVSKELWWFRYSYWSSSQSYVLTKGWIRFVKDKDLQAGDIISFERGSRQELYINCRKRPSNTYTAGQREDELQQQQQQPNRPMQQLHLEQEQGATLSSSSEEDDEDVQTGGVHVATTATRLFGVDLRAKPNQDSLIDIRL